MRVPGRESVQVVHKVRQKNQDGSWTRDGRGNAVYTEEITTITGCSLQPSTTTETDEQGRVQVSTDMLIYAPESWPGTAIDYVLARGERWQIVGDIEVWHHPRLGHYIVRVRRADG